MIALGADPAMVAAVKAVATEYHEAAQKDISAMPMRFFEAPAGSVADQIRKLVKIESENKLVLLDIPAGGKYYVCDGEAVDAAAVKAFIAEVEAGRVEEKRFG